ncbi:NADP-dependent oxidoreductase [Micromonospora sp. GCM10011542]|uniref:NADP-dependent oxidoreductase n=1 Tax=Micromonospora sp. GCM10011542 TaxID=3317337 RepID=UPI003621E972
MRAVALRRFGDPDVLEVVELPAPHAGPGEVRVRVHAATVNPVDILIRTGRSAVRLRPGEPLIPGLDIAGVVDEIGAGTVTDLAIGYRVMAMVNPTRPAGGGYAELVVLAADQVTAAPAGASHAEAATLPMNGLTAMHALDQLAVPAGGTIAVTGAAGAVGGYAVQLARAAGLRVLADAAPRDEALVAALGADAVVARGEGLAARLRHLAPGGVDGIVDAASVGAPLLPAIRAAGRLATVREPAPGLAELAAGRDVTLVPVFVHVYDGRPDKLDRLRRLAERRELTLRVATEVPPEQAGHAHRTLAEGGTRGRIVIAF